MKAESWAGTEAEDFIHVFVILEDDHPELDVQMRIDFRRKMGDHFDYLGIDRAPVISPCRPERFHPMTTPDSAPPTPVDWRNLIPAGRDLVNPQQLGRLPTDEHVRRAVSNIYYALFHALAESNATALIGSPSDALTVAAWSRVYRGLDHGTARRELQRHRQEFFVQARDFADA